MSTIVVVREPQESVVVTKQQRPQVVVNAVGVPGHRGPPGPPGPPGTTSFYSHTQGIPAFVWTVQHNFGYRPGGIVVIASDGSEVEPVVAHPSTSVCLLTFYEAVSGIAYIS